MEGRDYFAGDVAFDVLAQRARSEDPTERWAAAIELGELGTEEAARVLRHMLDDPNENVRDTTRVALRRFDKVILIRAGLPTEPQRAERFRLYRPGLARYASHLEAPPHRPWRIRPLPVPGKDADWAVDAAILDIVGTEGPLTGRRLASLYGRGVAMHGSSRVAVPKLQAAVNRVMERRLVSRSDDYTSDQLPTWVLHRTGSPGIVVRQRGLRELGEIPVNEVHEVLLELSRSFDGSLRIDRNQAFQMIFDFYKIEQGELHVVGRLLAEDWSPLLRVR